MTAFRIANSNFDPQPKRKPAKNKVRIRNEQMNIDLVPLPPIDLLHQIFQLDPLIPHGLRWKERPSFLQSGLDRPPEASARNTIVSA